MKHTIVIAEAGVNHNGNIETAKKLIDEADNAGADYIKFQSFIAEANISKNAVKADYQISNTGKPEESQLEMVKKLELSEEAHDILVNHCKDKRVKFLSTAFDDWSINLLKKYNLDFYKIASSEMNNLPYLRKIAQLNTPILLSTGMANIEEIRASLQALSDAGARMDQVTILHCNTEYPSPMEDINLKAIHTIKDTFGMRTGYSDHSLGIEVPIAAVALGAEVIEKHFTLDNKMDGPDHRASLEPKELKQMVDAIRNIDIALGSEEKRATPSELKNIPVMRKSIVAKKLIKKGETLSEENICIKRPGTGISPMRWDEIIGTLANRGYFEDDLILE